MRIRFYGRENIPAEGSVILAANHKSYLDPIVMGIGLRRKVNYMARASLFEHFMFGSLISRLNAFAVKDEPGNISAVKTAIRLLKQGKVMALFPEGTRAPANEFLPAQPGVGLVAQKSGAPIVPVYIEGTEKALSRKAKFIRPAAVKVYYGKLINSKAERFKDDYEKLAKEVMAEIVALKKSSQ